MAYDFSPQTPVLHYRPRAHTHFEFRESLLWPVYVYRVLAPRVRENKLDLFEKAVLGLSQAGETRPDEIARLLCLNLELATFIQDRLLERGLVDGEGRLSRSGGDYLTNARDLGHEMAVAFVFQDPWTRLLWPRVMEELQVVEAEHQHDRRVLVTLNTVGNPIRFVGHACLPGVGFGPRQPDAAEIVQAVHRHRRAINYQGTNAIEDDESDAPQFDPPLLQRVTLIDEEPRPYLLSTYIYLSARLEDTGWYACDPFGFGQSVTLYRQISDQALQDPSLMRVLERLLKQRQMTVNDLAVHMETQNELALLSVRERVPFLERQALGVFQRLVDMVRDWSDMNRDSPKDRLEDVVVKAAKTMEAVFEYLQHEYHAAEALDAMPNKDGEPARAWLVRCASQVGFSALPETLRTVRATMIRRAYEKQDGTLGRRIWATLLVARIDPDHPLRRAAQAQPDLLMRLGELIQSRDRSAHDLAHSLDYAKVAGYIEVVYESVGLLIGE